MDLNPAVLIAEPLAFAAGLGVLRVPVEVVRRRRLPVLAVLAALSGVVAATAGASATGWLPVDVILLGVLGAAAVLAGSSAPSGAILLSAMIAGAAGIDSVALPLALAAVGLTLVSLLIDAEPLVDALAGGLVAQAALRLTHPGGRGLTALVAAAALLVLLVPAARTLDRRYRQRLARVGLVLGGLAVVGAVVGALAAALSVGPLRRGLSVATATIDATSAVDLERTATGLSQAGRDFSKARSRLEAWWAFPARAVPVVGQHWRALQAAAVTGDELAEAGRRALGAPELSDVHVVDGRVPLEQLAAVAPQVADLATRATAARQRLDEARSAWLLPPLGDKLDTHLPRIRDIEKRTQLANRVLPVVPRLLGKDGPRRYFLAVQTPAEARGGGGFIGSYGEIVADDGRLSLTKFGRQDDLTRAPGQDLRTLDGPEDFIARYGRFRPELHWANVNLSPDFPTDAAVIANLYPQSGGAPIDGVIAIDPAGLATLLGLVGPIEVPSWPTPISATNALQILLIDQYQGYASRGAREDFLGDVAETAWRRLTTGALPPLPQLLASFGPAVEAKHVLFASMRADEQRLFQDLGVAGEVAPVAGDFVGLVTQNAGGNKIDYFLRREVDYRVALDPRTGRLQGSVKIALHNDAPSEGFDHGVIGNDLEPRLPPGTNKLYLSFYTPWDLAGGRIDGTEVAFERAAELGRKVYSAALVIPPKSTVVVELTLSGRLADSRPYRLDVHQQPLVTPDTVTTTLTVPGGWRTGAGGTEQTATWPLHTDATVEFPIRRR